ncbi:MAG: FtsX-like permease family protein [Lachnospiraceae bacterium]|nr:FtsX-like permease family protein [Lachnospiraceae bacterium]
MLKRVILRTIKKSLGRYLAILAIIALGVGFFIGLRVTEDAMRMTGNNYLAEKNLYDFRLISTLGFTREDVDAFKNEYGQNNAFGSVSSDFIIGAEGSSESVYHAHQLLEGINGLDLTAGRMPTAGNECIIDALYAGEKMLGRTLTLSASNSESTFDTFAYDEYKVVGIANASEYINFNRGTTSLAGGKATGFVYIPAEGFSTEYFTELFVSIPNDYAIYSDEYEELIDEKKDDLEAFLKERANIRYDKIYTEADDKIKDAEKELADAKNKLEDGKKELEDSRKELADGKEKIADGKEKLEESRQQIADGKKEIEEKKKELAEGREKLAEGQAEINASREAFLAEKAAATQALAENKAQLELMQQLPEYPMYLMAYEQAAAEAEAKFAEAETALNAAQAEVDNNAAALAEGEEALKKAEKEIADGEAELVDAEKTLAENEAKLSDGEQKIKDAEKEIADAEVEITEGEAKVSDARDELNKLEKPTTILLDRTTNIGYASFEKDIAIVSGVAKVFPLFFFLVAALVCITTMTRMVGEQRTQNGVLKAMGYSNLAIASQYLIYAGSASLFGCFAGFFAGSKLMPMTLWEVYHIMYSIKRKILFVLDWKLFAIVTVLYLISILGITYFICRRDLQTSASGLMRPEAPKVGKRIFLERIGFIWKPMKFLHKVTARNIFRYKKRMFMMILGIGGCTALLLTGFGIRDTIQPIVEYQYNEISLFDATAVFLKTPTAEQQKTFLNKASEYADSIKFVHSGNIDLVTENQLNSVGVIIYGEDMSEMVNLHRGTKAVSWPEKNEVVVDIYSAQKCGLSVGDKVILRNSDYKETEVVVSGIYDNHIGGVIYISKESYEAGFGDAPDVNTAYLIFKDGLDEHRAGANIQKMENVASVSIVSEMMKNVDSMLSSLDLIVLIVLVCAGALSFIVLFNLTNITITERQREIATLKVLGFFRKEQNAYIFRENIILTAISAVCGIPLGLALLKYVMTQIKIDGIYFGCRLAPISYLLAVVITMLFTVVVDLTLGKKLRKINMAEAMKAIE